MSHGNRFPDNHCILVMVVWSFPSGLMVKNLPANAKDMGSIPGLERSPGGGHGNPLQYSCLGKIPRAAKPGELQSTGLQRVRHDLVTEHAHMMVGLIYIQNI